MFSIGVDAHPCHVLFHECIVRRNVLHYRGRYTPITVGLAAPEDLALGPREQLPHSLVVGRVDDTAPLCVFMKGPLRPKGVVMLQQCSGKSVLPRPGNVDVVRANAELRQSA